MKQYKITIAIMFSLFINNLLCQTNLTLNKTITNKITEAKSHCQLNPNTAECNK